MIQGAQNTVKMVRCQTFHGRHGAISNAFRYHLDCLLIPVEEHTKISRGLLRHNKFGLFSFFDNDHGTGNALDNFANLIVENQKLPETCTRHIWLLTQPRYFGYVFNPVSFWFFCDADNRPRVVVAEVNNTVKGRHFYICRHDDFTPIAPSDRISVDKAFYVSPFQDVDGTYSFRFLFEVGRIGAWIDYKNGTDGVFATLTGETKNLSNARLIQSFFLRPFGALRVISLIHWQALKLKLKGGTYQKAPRQNKERITR